MPALTADQAVQYAVTALIALGVALFVGHRLRGRPRRHALAAGDKLDLVKVRHVRNGQAVRTGQASESSGGTLHLGEAALGLRWMLGAQHTTLAYAQIHTHRWQPFGRTRILILEMRGEERFWALWVRRGDAAALAAFLEAAGVQRQS